MPKTIEFKPSDRILTMKKILELVPYSRAHIYRLIKTGQFPTQVRLGANRIGWLESEICDWISEKISNRNNLI